VEQRRDLQQYGGANALVIGALAKAAYPNDLAHPYRIANKVCVILEVVGGGVSREAVAQKLKVALTL